MSVQGLEASAPLGLKFNVPPCTVTVMSKPVQPRYLSKEALYRKRVEAGLSQEQLAIRAGAIQSQVSNWERGHSGCKIGMLHKLAKALDEALREIGQPGCTPMDLMHDRSRAKAAA